MLTAVFANSILMGILQCCMLHAAMPHASCTDHEEKENKCVANMSLGGGLYQALNTAVEAVVQCGCPVVVAAGNSAADACNGSPSSSAGTTVTRRTVSQY